MEFILQSIPELSEDSVTNLVTLDQIYGIDPSFDETNPMTFVIYLEYNRQMLCDKEIETITKIIEKLKKNNIIIAKENINKFVNGEIKCE
tara:strand:- start:192 stop:461 length:270 start_codon:yes stop_codon:yes gene_type:complete